MLALALDAANLLADPVGALLLLCGAVITLFTLLAGAYLVLGGLAELATAGN